MNATSVSLLPNWIFWCVCVVRACFAKIYIFCVCCHVLFMHLETSEFRNSKHLSVTSIPLDKT